MCSLTPFGQDGPWKDYATSDLLHLAAGGQMAGCGYTEEEEPDAPPIAPGGGQAWHMGSHFAMMAIGAALLNRTVTGKGQYIDASVHEACALTTEAAVTRYIYTGQIVQAADGPPRLSHAHGQEPTPLRRRQVHQRRRPDSEPPHLGAAPDPGRLDDGAGSGGRHPGGEVPQP